MTGRCFKFLLIVTSLAYLVSVFSVCAPTDVYADSTEDIEKAGDVTAIVLPVAALAGTFIGNDPEGRMQFSKSWLVSSVIVGLTKNIVDKVRPVDAWKDQLGGANSFPSGHTASAFTGASFLNRRYGWKYGVPAYALAVFTAYSRVQADKHFWDDVTVGASISLLANWYYTTPYSKKMKVSPILGHDTYGLNVSLSW